VKFLELISEVHPYMLPDKQKEAGPDVTISEETEKMK
jgi:hypothetical protein